jgi:hypothetical protein
MPLSINETGRNGRARLKNVPCSEGTIFRTSDVRCQIKRDLGRRARFRIAPLAQRRVPTFVGASREGFRPGKLLRKQLATGELFTN